MKFTFKVGDRVHAIFRDDDNKMHDLKGNVVGVGAWTCEVEFPGWTEGHSGSDEDYTKIDRWYVGCSDIVSRDTPTIASALKVTPQARRVLSYIERHGDISPMEALSVLGVSRLASCIHELRRKAGYNIRLELRHDDAGHRYGRYFLAAA